MRYLGLLVLATLFSVAILSPDSGTRVAREPESESFVTGSAIEKRGCCSHHKGVCGCKDGRALCCDNKLSPTCGC